MKSINLITPTQNYNINSIRRIRLELDISGPLLSEVLSPSKDIGFVATRESIKNNKTYTDHRMNLVAIEFSKKAKDLQAELDKNPDNTLKIKTDYTVHDFYPPEPLPDELVEKYIEPLPRGSGPAGTLHFLLETDRYFNAEHTVREITDYCNNFRGTSWPPSHFTGLCLRLKHKGKFIRIDESNEDIRYKSANTAKSQ